MEHFALTKSQAEDYYNEDIWWLINERAKKNTLIYREIFACYPDDEAKDLV
jgi:phospholipase D1/2